MTSPYVQPSNEDQTGAQYKNNLDNAAAVFARQSAAFHVQAQAVPDMTVRILPGSLQRNKGVMDIGAQTTGVFTAPVGNPRIDRVVLNPLSGHVSVVAGVSSDAPTAPDIPSGYVPLARILLAPEQTEIVNADIADERTYTALSVDAAVEVADIGHLRGYLPVKIEKSNYRRNDNSFAHAVTTHTTKDLLNNSVIVRETADSNFHDFNMFYGPDIVGVMKNGRFSFEIEVKRVGPEDRNVFFSLYDGVNFFSGVFILDGIGEAFLDGAAAAAYIFLKDDGFYKIIVEGVWTAGAIKPVWGAFRLSVTGGNEAYLGDGVSGFELRNARLYQENDRIASVKQDRYIGISPISIAWDSLISTNNDLTAYPVSNGVTPNPLTSGYRFVLEDLGTAPHRLEKYGTHPLLENGPFTFGNKVSRFSGSTEVRHAALEAYYWNGTFGVPVARGVFDLSNGNTVETASLPSVGYASIREISDRIFDARTFEISVSNDWVYDTGSFGYILYLLDENFNEVYAGNPSGANGLYVAEPFITQSHTKKVTIGDTIPVGTTIEFNGTSPPDGYLQENGAAISRTTYAALFAAIGTTHGAGDGSTTFNIPDSRRRVAVGSGGTGTGVLGNAVGDKGGAETHALNSAENGPHDHTLPWATSGGGGSGAISAGAFTVFQSNMNTGSSGSGTAHNNLPPSIVKLKCIKY